MINKDKTTKCFFIILVFVGLLIIPIAGIREYSLLSQYQLPGEFDQQQAIWMQWPSEIYQLKDPVNQNMVSIIKAFAPHIRVNLIARSNGEIASIKNQFKTNGFSGENVNFYLINHKSIWARDVGPIFIKNGWGRLKVVDFGFDGYSRNKEPSYIKIESQVAILVAKLLGLPVIRTQLISEGGAIESNGRGVLMTTESVALKRNSGKSKEQVKKEYQRVLGVKKIIWLKKGLAEDDGITSGHINEITRFAAPNTILLAQVLPNDRYVSRYSQESYLRLEENFRILKNATDQDGKPFQIIRVPMPPGLYQEMELSGELPVRSYLNYAITNGVVLMQVYWKPGRPESLRTTEAKVRSLFQKVFPGREIIGIDAENVNRWGGGIHCVTQHMPK